MPSTIVPSRLACIACAAAMLAAPLAARAAYLDARPPVRFRFHLTRGQLYAFWVSADSTGASAGYVAAGGPGFTGATDTTGR